MNTTRKARIQALAESQKSFVVSDDGSYYYRPTSGGYISAEELRILASILDDKNKAIHDITT